MAYVSVGKAIEMGYVKTEFSAVDSEIFILIRDKSCCKVVKMPFYKNRLKKEKCRKFTNCIKYNL
jgi:glycine cleavage system aminomethyltransferase T